MDARDSSHEKGRETYYVENMLKVWVQVNEVIP